MAKKLKFRKELESLINKNSMENGSDTPDFILAEYLENCLSTFDKAVNQRSRWYCKSADKEDIKIGKEKIEHTIVEIDLSQKKI